MRTAPFAFFFLAALALTSCTQEALFPDPLAGTVRELDADGKSDRFRRRYAKK